ncbi:MAG: MgtC/SapB family protein [Elusimicrobiales bacterium]|nr:MgtC/SapB family protein [Elusimicrobiota bacterium]MDD7578895.1 MgtC/SapB family protein [Elusimicrobiota bacterium]MDO5764685.1 MgtC/SapB family protein [Elusimicrobiales bacterium]MDY6039591.1 MgtC/SapB family protein [Elusimicrobiaceae bacterium]
MQDILIKIFLALTLGGILGMERQYHDKPAGYATNCLICLGAMLFTVLSEYMGAAGGDPGRISAQIVTGVGFIGAGSILRDGNKISGLTTAAGVWLVAAIGMAVGYGQYVLAALSAASILVIQLGVRKTLKLVEFVKHYDTIYLTCEPKWNVVDKITKQIEKQNVSVLKREVTKQDNVFHVSLVATFTGHEFQNVTKELLEMPEVYSLYK